MQEILIVLLAAPFAIAIGAWLGRKVQRDVWRLDLSYDDRLRILQKRPETR